MSRRNAIARGALAALAGAALAAPSVLADHWELIPHGIGWNAVDSTPEKPPGVQHYWGGGHWIQWELHEGATLYFVDSHTYYYDEVHSPPDTRRPTGGGSWGAYSEAEFVAQLVPPGLSTWFDVWAYFPAKGNLRVEKKADVFGPVRPGEVVHHTLRYRNVGTKPIADAILEETIPSYMEHVSGGFPTGRKVSWTLGRLAPGQGGFVTVSMRLSEDIPPDVSRVHNVAVTKRDPDPPVPPPDTDAPPDETSDPAGAFVSRGDALVCRAASGDSEWMDTPAATEFAPLELLDVVRGGDQVRIPGGAADFRHTLADGTLSIVQGGFSMAPASELPRDAFSEIRVEPGSVFGHDVHGILNPAEYVAVQTPHLAMRINVGAYRFADAAGKETVTVTGGDVYVVDPESVEHKVSAGTTFEWPLSHSPAAGGPQIAGTTPADRTGVPWNDMTMTFAFDEPVTSIGAASRLAIHSEPEIASWSGTLDDLSAGGIITMSWNAAHDALTIRPLRPAGYATPGALWFALTLRDVVGASGTTALITKPMRLYRTDVTDGSGNLSGTWDHLAVSHTAGGLQTLQRYEVAQLDAPPVGLPASLAAATPVYTFRYLGAAAGTTKVSLRAGTRVPLPASAAAPGGLHRLVDGTWQRVTAGFGGEWTSADLAGTEFTVALLAPSIAFDPPVVTSVRPAPGAASADPGDPIVIEVLAPFGIDRKVTQVFVNGTRAFRYDPVHDTLPGWTIDEADGVTKLTYAPTLPWTAGACVYGQVVTASAYSGLAVRRDFAFNVKYSGRKDADRDWMPDAWESANGTAVGRNDRSEDLDGDGFSNQLECELGTSPQSSASAPFVGEMSAGTVGSHFRISRTGKAVKGVAVFVSPRIVRAKSKMTRAKVGRWIGDSATFELTSPLVPGAYDVWARVPKAPAARIGEIEIAGPAIDAVDPASGAANSRATILGSMFGTREPVVRLVSTATQKRTTCRVTKTTMDVRTGASRVAFVVPKVPAGTYQIVLDNRVDRATAEFVVR